MGNGGAPSVAWARSRPCGLEEAGDAVARGVGTYFRGGTCALITISDVGCASTSRKYPSLTPRSSTSTWCLHCPMILPENRDRLLAYPSNIPLTLCLSRISYTILSVDSEFAAATDTLTNGKTLLSLPLSRTGYLASSRLSQVVDTSICPFELPGGLPLFLESASLILDRFLMRYDPPERLYLIPMVFSSIGSELPRSRDTIERKSERQGGMEPAMTPM